MSKDRKIVRFAPPVPVKCSACSGKGTVVSRIGRMQFTTPCERCQGTGKEGGA